jgi:signal transduction histidine kinase
LSLEAKKERFNALSSSPILIIDDNVSLCRSIKLIFNKVGLRTVLAHSGLEALNVLKEAVFDIVLLDVRLPDADGMELLQTITDLYPNIAVIMITGHATVETAIEALTRSAVGYVTKPISMDELLKIVYDTLERQEFMRQKKATEKELELFGSLLRHDLGNDIQILIGDLEFIQHFSSDMKRESLEALMSALATTERMFSLISALKQAPDKTENRIVVLIENIARAAEKTHKHVSIEINAKEDPKELRVTCSRLLPMVFTNLISNSVKHGKGNVSVTIEIEQKDQKIHIIMYDNGPGIHDSVRSRLFNRGVSTSGGGYGLYLSKSIVEITGGTIELIDAKNAKFRIILPLQA